MPRRKMLSNESFVRTKGERTEIMLTKMNSYVQLCRVAQQEFYAGKPEIFRLPAADI
jgi:hypothetical protein